MSFIAKWIFLTAIIMMLMACGENYSRSRAEAASNNLSKGLGHSAVIERIGQPAQTTGSGVLHDRYEYEDGSVLVVSYIGAEVVEISVE